MWKKMATTAAALSLLAGSVAPAMAAHPLSVANSPDARAAAEVSGANELGNLNPQWTRLAVLGAIALLIIAGIALFDDDDGPDSP